MVEQNGDMYLLMVERSDSYDKFPKHIHWSLADAKKEAERLCRKENKRVYIFSVLNYVEPAEFPLRWGKND